MDRDQCNLIVSPEKILKTIDRLRWTSPTKKRSALVPPDLIKQGYVRGHYCFDLTCHTGFLGYHLYMSIEGDTDFQPRTNGRGWPFFIEIFIRSISMDMQHTAPEDLQAWFKANKAKLDLPNLTYGGDRGEGNPHRCAPNFVGCGRGAYYALPGITQSYGGILLWWEKLATRLDSAPPVPRGRKIRVIR